jgi:hypothetical protein
MFSCAKPFFLMKKQKKSTGISCATSDFLKVWFFTSWRLILPRRFCGCKTR